MKITLKNAADLLQNNNFKRINEEQYDIYRKKNKEKNTFCYAQRIGLIANIEDKIIFDISANKNFSSILKVNNVIKHFKREDALIMLQNIITQYCCTEAVIKYFNTCKEINL